MNKIKLCLEQNKGIELVEPNENTCAVYIKDAGVSLKAMGINEGKWKVVTSYYACYNAFYGLLQKVGIKCVIHDCTLEIIKLFDGFDIEDYNFIKSLKKERIDTQYYLTEPKEINEDQVRSFVLKCKNVVERTDPDVIKKIREVIKNG